MSKFYNEMQHRLTQAATAELVRQGKVFTAAVDVAEVVRAVLRAMKRVPNEYLRRSIDLPGDVKMFMDRMHDGMIDAFLSDEAISDERANAALARHVAEFPVHTLAPLREAAIDKVRDMLETLPKKVAAARSGAEANEPVFGCDHPACGSRPEGCSSGCKPELVSIPEPSAVPAPMSESDAWKLIGEISYLTRNLQSRDKGCVMSHDELHRLLRERHEDLVRRLTAAKDVPVEADDRPIGYHFEDCNCTAECIPARP